jgi:hypothetical protein
VRAYLQEEDAQIDGARVFPLERLLSIMLCLVNLNMDGGVAASSQTGTVELFSQVGRRKRGRIICCCVS